VSGWEPQEALRAIPAAAARMIAIFMVSFDCWLLLVSDSGVLRIQNYLIGATSMGAGAGFEQQEALTITPHAAATIAII
jgi:hypothetical protein